MNDKGFFGVFWGFLVVWAIVALGFLGFLFWLVTTLLNAFT